MAIDVGCEAINRAGTQTGNYTIITLANPANETGSIDHIEIYASGSMDIEVASFYYDETGYSTRGYSDLLSCVSGFNSFDAPGDFAEFSINSGDYIGFHSTSLNLAYTDGTGGDALFRNDDFIPYYNAAYSTLSRVYSVYATGGAGSSGPSIPALQAYYRQL